MRVRAVTAELLAGRSVFMTGAYGLLGSWLVKALDCASATQRD